MANDKEIIKKLFSIAEKQQKVITKLAQELHDPLNGELPEYKGPRYDIAPEAPKTPVAPAQPKKLPSQMNVQELLQELYKNVDRSQLESMLLNNVGHATVTKDVAKNIAPSGPGGIIPEKR